ncbi:MAG: 50S ribosomal protein L9 [Patescibacteria group bacterium]|nr:50S ribosomal protein L9 [Patescibacteria group bacterium]
MKVVIKQKVENVGGAGEVKDVADGFARNFLIPNGLAEPATQKNVSRAEESVQQKEKEQSDELKQIQNLAQKIDGEEFLIKAKAKEGKLFGSVDVGLIVEKLKESDVTVEESSVELKEPIKEVGEYQIKINFNHGIEATVKMVVEKE